MSEKLTRRERERIIFDYLKGKPDPLYEVKETNHGKYVVQPKQIQIEEEEEETKEEPLKPVKQEQDYKQNKQQLKRERRRQNRRAKQDAYRILEQLNRLLNTNDEEVSDESSSDEEQVSGPRAPPIIEQPNLNPNPNPTLSFRRKRLRF